jgi:hypothetical protein
MQDRLRAEQESDEGEDEGMHLEGNVLFLLLESHNLEMLACA